MSQQALSKLALARKLLARLQHALKAPKLPAPLRLRLKGLEAKQQAVVKAYLRAATQKSRAH